MTYKKQYLVNLTYHGKTNRLISLQVKESDVKIYDYTTWKGI